MPLEDWMQYIAIAGAVFTFVWKWPRLQRFVAVGLFASYYACIICFIAMTYYLWDFPSRLFPGEPMSVVANFIVIPVVAMVWVSYAPSAFSGLVVWNLLWSVLLTAAEYYVQSYTELIRYHNGYDWYYTLILWVVSWPVWLYFHRWHESQLCKRAKQKQ